MIFLAMLFKPLINGCRAIKERIFGNHYPKDPTKPKKDEVFRPSLWEKFIARCYGYGEYVHDMPMKEAYS